MLVGNQRALLWVGDDDPVDLRLGGSAPGKPGQLKEISPALRKAAMMVLRAEIPLHQPQSSRPPTPLCQQLPQCCFEKKQLWASWGLVNRSAINSAARNEEWNAKRRVATDMSRPKHPQAQA